MSKTQIHVWARYARVVSDPVPMPVAAAIRLAHATVQTVADQNDCDVLHIKGPAVDGRLLAVDPVTGEPVRRLSSDADVWVSPNHVKRLLDALGNHGWKTMFRFGDGSPFQHASTLSHPALGYVDVHRSFPGIGLEPQRAFDVVWRERTSAVIGGRPCWVPSVTAQRLVLILHAARNGTASSNPDIRRTWTDAGTDERAELLALGRVLRAEVALAAGTGRLETFRRHREYRLWKMLSRGQRRTLGAMWLARVQAARTPGEAVRIAVRLVAPKRQRLAVRLGRAPTSREIASACLAQCRLVLRELSSVLPRRSR